MAITLDTLSEPLRIFLSTKSAHFRNVDWASPKACAFAKEVWEAAQRYESEAAIALAVPIDEGIDCQPLRSMYALSSNRQRACSECGDRNCNGECSGDGAMGD